MLRIFLTLILLCTFSCSHSLNNQGPSFDSELMGFEYPYSVQHFKFKSQRQILRMAYMDQGHSPDTYVLFHGKNFSGYYFKGLMDKLLASGARVIVIDQIGFGKSSKPNSYQFSFQQLAINTQMLLSSIGVKNFKLIGHSMGGMLATRYALMYPKEVQKLILINPIGLEDWKTMTSSKSIDGLYSGELGNSVERARQYQKESYYAGDWKPEYEELLTPLKGWLNGPDREVLAWNAALTSDMVFNQPIIYEVANLKVPTTLIVGTRDRTAIGRGWAPDDIKGKMGRYDLLGKAFKKLNPKMIELIEIEGLGHVPFIEAPDKFWTASQMALTK